MIRVPVDPPGLRRKLDVQWMKGIWVGRLDESDGHVVLTPHGIDTGRSVRRLAGNLRVQPDLVGKIKSFQDPALSQAELLRVPAASVPFRLSDETVIAILSEAAADDARQKNQQISMLGWCTSSSSGSLSVSWMTERCSARLRWPSSQCASCALHRWTSLGVQT